MRLFYFRKVLMRGGQKKIPTPQKGQRCRKIKHTMRKLKIKDKVYLSEIKAQLRSGFVFR